MVEMRVEAVELGLEDELCTVISDRALSHIQARYSDYRRSIVKVRASCLFHRQLTQEKHMKPVATPPSRTVPADEDLAEQARPGHRIPSQDPDPATQIPLEPKEVDREAKSVLVSGGLVAGAATGAAIGVVVAGPWG